MRRDEARLEPEMTQAIRVKESGSQVRPAQTLRPARSALGSGKARTQIQGQESRDLESGKMRLDVEAAKLDPKIRK